VIEFLYYQVYLGNMMMYNNNNLSSSYFRLLLICVNSSILEMDIEWYICMNELTFDFSKFLFFRICFRMLWLIADLALVVD